MLHFVRETKSKTCAHSATEARGVRVSYGSQKSEDKFHFFLLSIVLLSLFGAVVQSRLAGHRPNPSASNSHPLSYLHSITFSKPDL